MIDYGVIFLEKAATLDAKDTKYTHAFHCTVRRTAFFGKDGKTLLSLLQRGKRIAFSDIAERYLFLRTALDISRTKKTLTAY